MYCSLQYGFFEYRPFVSRNSLSKSAQYLRSSIELVWCKVISGELQGELEGMGYRKTKARQRSKTESICFTDPEDGERKETINNARKSWKFPWRRPCLARWEQREAQSGCRTLQPRLEKLPAWNLGEVKSKTEGYSVEAQRDKQKVHFATLMDICHVKKCGVRKSTRGTKNESCSEVRLWKTTQELLDVICETTWLCTTSSRRSIRLHPSKNGGRPKLRKIPASECPDLGIRLPQHKWPKSWSNVEDPVVPLERNLYGHPLAGFLWEGHFEEGLLEHGWEKVPSWECLFVHRKQGLFESVHVSDIKVAGKRCRIWLPCGRNWWNLLTLKNQHHFWTTCTWDALNVHVNRTKWLLMKTEKMFESRISAATEKLLVCEKLHTETVAWSYDMEGHAKKVRWEELRIGK